MGKKLLAAHTYPPPPATMRVKYLLKKDWPILIFLAILLVTCILSLIANGMTGTTAAMMGLLGVVIALGGWMAWWHSYKTFRPFYRVHGVYMEFESTAYYVPPEVMGPFIREIIDKFAGHTGPAKIKLEDLCKGVTLVVQDTRPKDPLERVSPDRVVGISYTRLLRTSYIYGPYALDHGGLGYELRLQCCAYLFPERPEREDIAWMQARKIM